jgi:hypothetical protein
MIPCELDNGKNFIKKITLKGWQSKMHFQGIVNNLQHHKSIRANATTRIVIRIRWEVSHPSFTGDDKDEVYATVGLVVGVPICSGVGNCRLLQTVWVPVISVGVEVAYPEPAGPWLGKGTVGLTSGPGCEMLLLESMLGVFVICHTFEPSGMRAYE